MKFQQELIEVVPALGHLWYNPREVTKAMSLTDKAQHKDGMTEVDNCGSINHIQPFANQ